MSDATASSSNIVAEVIDNGQVSGQQILVIGLCMFLNMLDGFDITAMAVVATGGLAPLFAEGTDVIEHLDQELTLRGLAEVYRRSTSG